MHNRLNIVFGLIVLVPLLLLAGLAIKIARDERSVVEQQVRALHEERLADIASGISARIGELERELDRVTAEAEQDPEKLRELVRKHPLLVQAFALSADGDLLFPSETDQLSVGEKTFLERTRAIWKGEAMLYEPPRAEQKGGSTRRGGRGTDSLGNLATRRENGWIAWYWEEGLHLLYWSRSEKGGVIGAEIGRIPLLSQVVGELPALDPGEARIVLADSKGDEVFQWGERDPIEKEKPLARLALAYPLDSYALQYFAAPGAPAFGQSIRFNLLASFGAVALVILGLAIYFHREQSRAMREAGQRVTFVTQVSHELKTPLTNIRLYAELLEDRIDPEDNTGSHHLSVIVAESQRLSRMIGNILTFSKQQRDKLHLNKTPLSVNSVVDSVLEQFRPSLEGRGMKAVVSGTAPRDISADRDMIGQILGNLLSNVEKYAGSGGEVKIEIEQDDGWTHVRVADRGPGIPAIHRDKIFQPFYRVSDKLSDGVTGTGIGLSIARELARLHGGDLALIGADGGTTFELTLPNGAAPSVIREETRA